VPTTSGNAETKNATKTTPNSKSKNRTAKEFLKNIDPNW